MTAVAITIPYDKVMTMTVVGAVVVLIVIVFLVVLIGIIFAVVLIVIVILVVTVDGHIETLPAQINKTQIEQQT